MKNLTQYISTFKAQNPEFDWQYFAHWNAQDFNNSIGHTLHADTKKLKPKRRKALQTYQRLYRLTQSHPEAEALLAAGYHSAVQIAQEPEPQFVAAMRQAADPALPEGRAQALHRAAKSKHARTVLAYTQAVQQQEPHYRQARFAKLGDGASVRSSLPSYQELFQAADLNGEASCRSMLSPAAYFVDLMRLEAAHITANSDIYSLNKRRPDLWQIPLSCEETNTEVSKLSLVNAVLEGTLTDANADPTEATLAQATYPWGLPYNAAWQSIEATLASKSTSASQLWDALHPNTDLDRFTLPAHPDRFPKRYFLAQLDLSPELWQVITNGADGIFDYSKLAQYYGLSTISLAGKELAPVATFLQQTGLSRTELDRLLTMNLLLTGEALSKEAANFYINGLGLSEGNPDPMRIERDAKDENIENIENITDERLNRINAFVRLAQALQWPYEELDWVLRTLSHQLQQVFFQITDDYLPILAWIKQWSDTSGQSRLAAAGLFGPLQNQATHEGPSFFHQVFSPTATANLPHSLAHDQWLGQTWTIPGTEGTPGTAKDRALQTMLATALQLSEQDLIALARQILAPLSESLTLDATTVARLYRLSQLPAISQLTVSQLTQADLLDPLGKFFQQVLPDTYSQHEKGLTALLLGLMGFQAFEQWRRSTPFTVDHLQFLLVGNSRVPALQNQLLGQDATVQFRNELLTQLQPLRVTAGELERALPTPFRALHTTGRELATTLADGGIMDTQGMVKDPSQKSVQKALEPLETRLTAALIAQPLTIDGSALAAVAITPKLTLWQLLVQQGIMVEDATRPLHGVIQWAVWKTKTDELENLIAQQWTEWQEDLEEVEEAIEAAEDTALAYINQQWQTFLDQLAAIIQPYVIWYINNLIPAFTYFAAHEKEITEEVTEFLNTYLPQVEELAQQLTEDAEAVEQQIAAWVQAAEQELDDLINDLEPQLEGYAEEWNAAYLSIKQQYADYQQTQTQVAQQANQALEAHLQTLLETSHQAQNQAIHTHLAHLLDVSPAVEATLAELVPMALSNFLFDGVAIPADTTMRLHLLQRYALMFNSLNLSDPEAQSVTGIAARLEVNLPHPDDQGISHLTWSDFRKIYQFKQFIFRYQDSQNHLISYLTWAATADKSDAEEAIKRLSTFTQWSSDSLTQLVAKLPPTTYPVWASVPGLYLLQAYLDTQQQLGINLAGVLDIAPLMTDTDTDYTTYAATQQSLWAGLQKEGKNLDALRYGMMQHKRDHLVPLVMYHLNQTRKLNLATPRDLYEYLLIDVEVEGVVQTSPIKAAISSVQLYLYRCLNQLETVTFSTPDDLAELWTWMAHYRTWQANREVFLFPENYLEPQLRKNKTPQFSTLESALNQIDLTDPMALEGVFRSYLEGFGEVAQLQIVGANTYEKPDGKTLFLVGKTPQNTAHYYYQMAEFAKNADNWEPVQWQPWKPITCPLKPIQSNEIANLGLPIGGNATVAPLYQEGTWHLYWQENQQTGVKQTIPENSRVPSNVPDTQPITQRAYLLTNGTWSTPHQYFPKLAYQEVYRPQAVYDEGAFYLLGATGESSNNLLIQKYDLENGRLTNKTLLKLNGQGTDFFLSSLEKVQGSYYLSGYTTHPKLQFAYIKLDSLDANEGEVVTWGDGYSESSVIIDNAGNPAMLYAKASAGFFPNLEATPPTSSSDDSIPMETIRAAYCQDTWYFVWWTPDTKGYLGSFDPNAPGGIKKLAQLDKEEIYYLDIACFGDTLWIYGADKQYNLWYGSLNLQNPNQIQNLSQPGIQCVYPLWQNSCFVRYGDQPQILYSSLNADYQILNLQGNSLMLGATKPTASDKNFIIKQHNGAAALVYPYQKGNHSQRAISLNTSIISTLRHRLSQEGLMALLSKKTQQTADLWMDTLGLDEDTYFSIKPTQQINFYDGPMALYFWELFFYGPWLLADTLSQGLQYAQARQWYETIYNPAGGGTLGQDTNDRYWKFVPLTQAGDPALQQEYGLSEVQSLQKAEASPKQWWDYHHDPFDPHALARLRPMAYQKVLVMQYINNFIAWGDSLYKLYTIEDINEAEMLYVMAYDLLGKPPKTVAPPPLPAARTLAQLLSDSGDALRDLNEFLIELENNDPSGSLIQPAGADPLVLNAYFGLPGNRHFRGYWDTVQQRLYDIRHGLNMDGEREALPLFQPPVSPMALVSQIASGEGVAKALNPLTITAPLYRFRVVVQKANEVVGSVIQLGQSLLAALEKKDGEALQLLLNVHQQHLQALTLAGKQENMAQVKANVTALQASKAGIQERISYYTNLLKKGLNAAEISQIALDGAAGTALLIANGTKLGAGIAYDFPTVFGFSDGGMNPGGSAMAFAAMSEGTANVLSTSAGVSGTVGSFQRRAEEWQLQKKLAEDDLKHLHSEIQASQYQLRVIQQEQAVLKKGIEQAQKVEAFYKTKFTSQQLYRWMAGRISTLYFQAYQLAVELGQQAEHAWAFERGLDPGSVSFIQPQQWDSLHQGLLAGNALQLNLQRMEMEFLKQDERRLEVTYTKVFPVTDHIPTLSLGQPEGAAKTSNDVFGNSYKCRLIKNVSISIPAVIGPYENIHATLTQVTARLEDGGAATSTHRSVAISRGLNDNGMFQLNLNDERFLPFEGTGLISTWQLEFYLQGGCNASLFDEKGKPTFNQIIMEVQYTALP